MFNVFRRSLKARLIAYFLAFGLAPLVGAWFVMKSTLDSMVDIQMKTLEVASVNILDVIERNLFERYGDAQAFGLNSAVLDKNSWYKAGSENRISEVMNQYMSTYTPVYEVMMLVDTQGKLIAVNTKDFEGETIKTESLYKTNFSGETWFKQAMAGEFTKSEALTGTVVTEPSTRPEISEIMGDKAGSVMGFTAPVKDSTGKVVAVWHNWVRMALVNDILVQQYKNLPKSAEMAVIDANGILLTEYHPEGGADHQNKDTSVEENLVADGSEAAKKATLGENGALVSKNADGAASVTGFANSEGAMGYPGLKWSMLIAVPPSDVFNKIEAAQKLIGLLVIVTIVAVSLVAIFVGNATTRPVAQMSNALAAIQAGSSDVEITHYSKDEIGNLADAMRYLLNKLNNYTTWAEGVASGDLRLKTNEDWATGTDMMSKAMQNVVTSVGNTVQSIKEASSRVSSLAGVLTGASANISSSAEDVAQRALSIQEASRDTAQASNEVAKSSEHQAIMLTQVAALVGEMSAAIEQVMHSVETVAEATSHATETANAGGEAVASTIDGMSKISDKTAEVGSKLEHLNEKSNQVGAIVSLIDEIAEQTNLLALNAAIEAARAGEHGRGFAVVAEEVRKLAERCAQATREISSLITEMRSIVDDSSTSMNEANDVVQSGVQLSTQARVSLEEILDTVSNLANPVGQVLEQSEAVSRLVDQVSDSISQAAAATEQNAASAEEMAACSSTVSDQVNEVNAAAQHQMAATEELTAQASELRELASEMDAQVGQFRTNFDESSTTEIDWSAQRAA